ncbi:hypothetical protein BSKO_09717 [Bryopsis sp. KO-2023]|nr:hypothetical protein BSKO_09717 [Bryopsis sp. KO-2023]
MGYVTAGRWNGRSGNDENPQKISPLLVHLSKNRSFFPSPKMVCWSLEMFWGKCAENASCFWPFAADEGGPKPNTQSTHKAGVGGSGATPFRSSFRCPCMEVSNLHSTKMVLSIDPHTKVWRKRNETENQRDGGFNLWD